MEKTTNNVPGFADIVDEIKKSTALSPKDKRNQTLYTIDDLLSSHRFLSTRNKYNTIDNTKENITLIESYPIDIDESRGYITIQDKANTGNICFIDQKKGIIFNNHNNGKYNDANTHREKIQTFFDVMKELYAKDSDILSILNEREKEFIRQYPSKEIADTFTTEKE